MKEDWGKPNRAKELALNKNRHLPHKNKHFKWRKMSLKSNLVISICPVLCYKLNGRTSQYKSVKTCLQLHILDLSVEVSDSGASCADLTVGTLMWCIIVGLFAPGRVVHSAKHTIRTANLGLQDIHTKGCSLKRLRRPLNSPATPETSVSTEN